MLPTKSKAPAVDGAVQILQLLARSSTSLSLSEISEETGLAYSTTHRLLEALLQHGMISIDPSARKKYCMGAAIFQLASTVFSRQDSISIFHPIAEILKNETYQSVYLNIEVGSRIVTIAKTESSMARVSNVYIGTTFPVYEAAPGKAILSTRPARFQEDYLAQVLPKGQNAPQRLAAMLEELQQARRLGYAVTESPDSSSLSFIAAPVLDLNNQAIAAISLGVNREEFTKQHIRELSAHLIQATRQLSSRLQ
ncbi:IclR family transcriptional regulator [Photobacterium atrarenae]|uniref:IclR family transcriptional regulator n=1 Tax=Photobacterium atrarenae TaxID=865757 RepID=A0ABY5GMC8_9GAMM|nr:IclR family transcriptional regulator [Photobacterium atrarenae]UTV30488.1 IclR family transcriptional regulator [Photobacterium atrarenae]